LAPQRGFTLVELVVVVIIITVLAAMAIPSITERMRDRRVRQAAEQVAMTYRNARMRAMGRGSAVLVRFDGSAAGVLEVREGVQGGTTGCAPIPDPGCVGRTWITQTPATDDNRVVSRFSIADRGEFPDTNIALDDPSGVPAPQMDVCFTPLGRAYVRYGTNLVFAPLIGVPSARVFRMPGSTVIGRVRRVMLLPNGTARLAL
jgi:type IV fimbrial biogenesis protein FimT